MKIKLFFLLLFTLHVVTSFSQEEKSISDQIKIERDTELGKISNELNANDKFIDSLRLKLSNVSGNTKKVDGLKKLQIALEQRLKKLEEKPKTKIRLNGQLALTELLSIQRDIKPADLFLKSQTFFNNLGEIGDVSKYNAFRSWKVEYDKWYKKKKSSSEVITLINNSINIVSDISNKVPIYGSISQTITSGLTSVFSSIGNRYKELKNKTPEMINLLNMISQFEQQKSIIDYEWKLINKELEQLKSENLNLLKTQLKYYDLSYEEFLNSYLTETLENKRDDYKENCRKAINTKIAKLEINKDDSWLGDIETYMYKVQSIRMRFGQLTNRMLLNIDKYNDLITVYNKPSYPLEFTTKISSLSSSLKNVRSTFYNSFNPIVYIEDSATMYIGSDI
ncbi:hypothetical protein C7447_103381 [Tenacibaculum adriaticum]|uniref:Outer membrane efflux protein n=1 Tax=Tenacibaculum adriaticum TaxID=413713 RepID=A0A5S5DQH4_9FLAO|nr:hypothetical protein [Tenacibaculum adriaticum]TYP98210.1 hypothetical protein C7447_103381 [Tenacibaculum adriaticum]